MTPSNGTLPWHRAKAPRTLGAMAPYHMAPSNGTAPRPIRQRVHGTLPWHPIRPHPMVPYYGTQQWHHVQSVKVCPSNEQWHLTTWHPAMAPSNGTTSNPPTCAPTQWHLIGPTLIRFHYLSTSSANFENLALRFGTSTPTLWANALRDSGLWLSNALGQRFFRFVTLTLQRFGPTLFEIRDFGSPTLWANIDSFSLLFRSSANFENLALRFGTSTLQRFGPTLFEIRDVDSPTPWAY